MPLWLQRRIVAVVPRAVLRGVTYARLWYRMRLRPRLLSRFKASAEDELPAPVLALRRARRAEREAYLASIQDTAERRAVRLELEALENPHLLPERSVFTPDKVAAAHEVLMRKAAEQVSDDFIEGHGFVPERPLAQLVEAIKARPMAMLGKVPLHIRREAAVRLQAHLPPNYRDGGTAWLDSGEVALMAHLLVRGESTSGEAQQ